MIAVNAMTHVMLLVSKATTINNLRGEGWKKPRKKNEGPFLGQKISKAIL